MPNTENEEEYLFVIQAIKSGEYQLSFRLAYQNRPVDIAVDKNRMDEQGFTRLGSVKIKN